MQSLWEQKIGEPPHLAPIAHPLWQSPPPPELNEKLISWKITNSPSTRWLALLGLSLIPLVGLADYATGPEILVALFYIPPVAMAAWFGGRKLGLLAAIASAAVKFAAAIPQGAQHWSPLIHFWNTTLQLFVCSFVALLFSSVRTQRDKFKLLAEEKAAALEQEIAKRHRLEGDFIEVAVRKQREIAHDLHDNVGQHLVGIAIRTKLLEQKLRTASPCEADELAAIVDLTNEAVKQTRLTARKLDAAESVGDLRTALQRLVTNVQQNCNVDGRLKTDSRALPVTPPVAGQLYRIAQQAVHNAVEHGGTEKLQIDLASDGKEIVLSVRDNGRGFDASAATEGMGLGIMRYRAQRIGGSCEVRSTSGGTTITCRVPMCAVAA